MSDDFKKKLQDYFDGKLNEEERIEIEKELDKLEIYQELLDEELKEDEIKEEEISHRKHRKMIKRGKWKARFHNAFSVIGIIIIITFISSIITGVYYSSGTPSRNDIYRDVIDSSIAIKYPNMRLTNSGGGNNIFFSYDLEGDLEKKIGGEYIKAGKFEGKFFFNKLNFAPLKRDSIESIGFSHPDLYNEIDYTFEWKRLENLHEGTVAEAYLSFDKLYKTNDILEKFRGEKLEWLWVAVDTGFEDEEYIISPIGFPSQPMWHYDDLTLENREVEKGLFGNRVVSESRSSPSVDMHGDEKLRNENFLKTLKLIQEHKSIADRILHIRNLDERIEYIEEHGVKIYGMVVTGPSKEILKLKDEDWVTGMKVGEVELWNIKYKMWD